MHGDISEESIPKHTVEGGLVSVSFPYYLLFQRVINNEATIPPKHSKILGMILPYCFPDDLSRSISRVGPRLLSPYFLPSFSVSVASYFDLLVGDGWRRKVCVGVFFACWIFLKAFFRSSFCLSHRVDDEMDAGGWRRGVGRDTQL